MTNYSSNTGSVLISFFRPSGKWYMDDALDMSKVWKVGPTPYDAVRAAMLDQYGAERKLSLMEQFIVVVMDPYHEHAYPVMLTPEFAGRN